MPKPQEELVLRITRWEHSVRVTGYLTEGGTLAAATGHSIALDQASREWVRLADLMGLVDELKRAVRHLAHQPPLF